MCLQGREGLRTACGTPQYMAPAAQLFGMREGTAIWLAGDQGDVQWACMCCFGSVGSGRDHALWLHGFFRTRRWPRFSLACQGSSASLEACLSTRRAGTGAGPSRRVCSLARTQRCCSWHRSSGRKFSTMQLGAETLTLTRGLPSLAHVSFI